MPTTRPPGFRRRAVEFARQSEQAVAVIAKAPGSSE